MNELKFKYHTLPYNNSYNNAYFFLLIVYVSNFRNRVRVWIYMYFFYINYKPTFIHDDLFRDFRDKLGRDFYFCNCALSTLILINTDSTKTSLWREIFAAKKNSWFSRIFSLRNKSWLIVIHISFKINNRKTQSNKYNLIFQCQRISDLLNGIFAVVIQEMNHFIMKYFFIVFWLRSEYKPWKHKGHR